MTTNEDLMRTIGRALSAGDLATARALANEDLMRTIGRALSAGDLATARALAAYLAPLCDSTGVLAKYVPVREVLDGIAEVLDGIADPNAFHSCLDLARIESGDIGIADLIAALDAAKISIISMRLMPAEEPRTPYWRVGVSGRDAKGMMVGHPHDHAEIIQAAEARGSWGTGTTMTRALAEAIRAHLVRQHQPADAE